MRNLPPITLERTTYQGMRVILLHFPYDVQLVNRCKDMSAKWSQSNRCWYVLDVEEGRVKLMQTFKGHAWLHWPVAQKQRAERKEQVEQLAKKPLTPPQSAALEQMHRLLVSLGRSESTVVTYEQLMEKMLRYLDKPPLDLVQDDIIRFQSDHLVAQRYAESTQRQFVTAARYFLEANHLPALDTSKVKGPRKAKALPKVLTRSEVMAILSSCPNLKHRTMLSLLYSSGLRIGEMIDLRLDDIQWESKAIHIKRAKGRKDRVVAIGEQMAIMLRNYTLQFRPIEFLFNGQANMKYTQTSVRAVLKRAKEKAGIFKKVTPHMLRHSYATHMIEDGVNLRYVQALLGHSRPDTTQIYTHVATEHLMKLKNPFDQLMKEYGTEISNRIDLTKS